RNVEVQGRRIKRDQEEQLRLLADSKRRIDIEQSRVAEEERLRRRVQTFSNLMAQARYEDAYLQALAIQQDAISSGRGVPPARDAGYDIGLAANNLSQIQELKRLREERFLLTMMQVERSHIPFPDEPPVVFPPTATWVQVSAARQLRYGALAIGITASDTRVLQSLLTLQKKFSVSVYLS